MANPSNGLRRGGMLKKAVIALVFLWAVLSLAFYMRSHSSALTRIPPFAYRSPVHSGGLVEVVEDLFGSAKKAEPEHQGAIAEREAKEDELYFAKIDEDLQKRGITQERYLMMFPAFGPNNQYLATCELMIWAKTLRRTVVLPNYIAHKKLGPSSHRPFNETFDPTPFPQWYKTISLEEYKQRCNSEIEVATYMHEPGGFWTASMNNYCDRNGLKQPKKVVPPRPQRQGAQYNKPDYFTLEDITKYWAEWDNVTCLGLAFPFRHMWGDRMERRMFNTAKYFVHAQLVRDLAAKALKDMKTEPGKYLAIHWRDSEEGCYSEVPDMHKGFDFCTGAGAYHWAKITDFIDVLKKVISDLGVSVIYLATDSKREDVIDQLRDALPLKVADDVATLRMIDDNYYLSLVEQEIAMQATYFVGTELSTWSEFILHWMAGTQKPLDRYANVHWLFQWNEKKWERHDVWNNVIGKTPGSWQESQSFNKFMQEATFTCPNATTVQASGAAWTFCKPPQQPKECSIISARRNLNEWELEKQLLDHFPTCNVLYLNPDLKTVPADGFSLRLKHEKVLLDSREYPAPPRERKLLTTVLKEHGIAKAEVLVMNLDKREWFVLNKLMLMDAVKATVKQIVLVGNVSPLWDSEKQCHDAECYAYARDFKATLEKLESEHGFRHFAFKDDGKLKRLTLVNTALWPSN